MRISSLRFASLVASTALAAVAGCSSGGGAGNIGSGSAGTSTTGQAGSGSAGTSSGSAGSSNPTGAAGTSGAAGTQGVAGTTGAAGTATDGGADTAQIPPTGPCAPPTDIYSPIDKLSQTGCMDPVTLTNFVSRAVPYEVNSPLWSDGATKSRAFVLPTGMKIHVKDCAANPTECPQGAADTGKWVFPVGTVMIKNFMFDGKFVETRLFMRVNSGSDSSSWVGYGYEWNEAQTEATIAPTDRDLNKSFHTGARTVTWNYPSRADCIKCHDPNGGSTLGPETAQMNRVVNNANQIDTFTAMGVFETPPAKPYKAALVAPYPGQAGSPPAGTSIDVEARSYMHANCAFCHRPQGQYPNFDLRFDTAFADRMICNAMAKKPIMTSSGMATKIFVPGDHANSAMWQRAHELDPDKGRMPQIGSYVIDTPGVQLIADWIDSIAACP
jgi:uncharacterized repeat protein (TIGR03806 family)